MEWLQVQDARDQGMTDQLRHQRNEIARNQGCEEGKLLTKLQNDSDKK